ncbi:MAG: sigma-70 family RNA polymerase sigma factor, partial [Chloroflexi bacterium]|nr:sigma-70 family RNA polymerase sigma factor [Chloroflexota bacterium]
MIRPPSLESPVVYFRPSNSRISSWAGSYQPLIFRLTRQRGLQDADAREVTQEVLVSVAGAIGHWQSDPSRGSFRGWLATIARN